jgi:hypothetical protein
MELPVRSILFFVAVMAEPVVFRAVVVALASLVLAQAVFWTWTFPANKATDNWTAIPDNWEILRKNWEYSHLAGAVFQLICAGALTVAMLADRTRA